MRAWSSEGQVIDKKPKVKIAGKMEKRMCLSLEKKFKSKFLLKNLTDIVTPATILFYVYARIFCNKEGLGLMIYLRLERIGYQPFLSS